MTQIHMYRSIPTRRSAMPVSRIRSTAPEALVQIAIGLAIGIGAVGVPLACTSSGQLTPVMRCKLDALKILPKDPGMVTPYDAVDLWHRIHDCNRVEADGGAP